MNYPKHDLSSRSADNANEHSATSKRSTSRNSHLIRGSKGSRARSRSVDGIRRTTGGDERSGSASAYCMSARGEKGGNDNGESEQSLKRIYAFGDSKIRFSRVFQLESFHEEIDRLQNLFSSYIREKFLEVQDVEQVGLQAHARSREALD